jgi:ATP-dependent RNA helicase DDX60
MSFVPAPQQANAASLPSNNGITTVTSTNVGGSAASAAPETTDHDLLFKMRTFDVFWVEKKALMYKDGIAKVNIELEPDFG